jgi:hypothetical protein
MYSASDSEVKVESVGLGTACAQTPFWLERESDLEQEELHEEEMRALEREWVATRGLAPGRERGAPVALSKAE